MQRFDLSHAAPWRQLMNVAGSYADVRVIPLPRGLDGLACRYPAQRDRPAIYVDADLPDKRRRFTLAHELAHIVLGWHCHALNACEINVGAELEDATATDIALDEVEANLFAAHLLIPSRFIRELMSMPNRQDAIKRAFEANASSTAICLRLLPELEPGWSFVQVARDGTVAYSGRSAGTQTNVPYRGQRWAATTFGKFATAQLQMSGPLKTFWYRHDTALEPESVDERDSKELLNTILADLDPSRYDLKHLRQSINGVIGSLHSTVLRANGRRDEFHALLRQRFEGREEYGDVVDHPLWLAFLARKAQEVMQEG